MTSRIKSDWESLTDAQKKKRMDEGFKKVCESYDKCWCGQTKRKDEEGCSYCQRVAARSRAEGRIIYR